MQATIRAGNYLPCGSVIGIAIVVLLVHGLSSQEGCPVESRISFNGELAGLVPFGIAWMTASRILPIITRAEERLSLSP